MDDVTLDRLLSGDLNKIPKLPKRVVRLFISSTFTDMTLERNSLMERVYPRLKKYCRERHGLDFQVVDMRWGVRDEATDDHQTVNLCSKEIENCQRVSLGPNFVALIGDKYGFRPLLNRIKSTEYRSLRRCLIESDINTDFLDTWYREDLNAVPAEYILQPISSILKNFTNKSEPELQMIDQRIWQAIQGRLHALLLTGSSRLVKQGRMSELERSLKYSISVTEREVIEGCLDLNETKSHCLVYVRSIVDLRDHLSQYFEDLAKLGEHQQHQLEPAAAAATAASANDDQDGSTSSRRDSAQRRASLKIGDDSITLTTSGPQTAAERRLERQRRLMSKYIDLSAKETGDARGSQRWEVDEEAQQALGVLREVKLKSKLAASGRNLTIYQVHWNNQEGVSMKSDEHKRYLDELTEHFYSNLTRMIRNAVKSERSKVETRGLAGEVLQHSYYSLQVGRRLLGRTRELELIRDYILTGSCRRPGADRADSRDQPGPVLPMLLYGVSGAGKTSVLARAATVAHEWLKQTAARRRHSSAEQNIFGPQSGAATSRQVAQATARSRWDRTPCVIMRFCGTTPMSSSVVGMLTSVCRQLQYQFYQFGPLNGLMDDQVRQGAQATMMAASPGPASSGGAPTRLPGRLPTSIAASNLANQLPFQQIPGDFVRLVYTFRQLLENCRHALHKRRTFVIIIDSIDRLSPPAECSVEAKFSWLTNLTRLPSNVRLLVSCGSSGASRCELEEYLHLKRHFLRAHLRDSGEHRVRREADSAATTTTTTTATATGSSDGRSSDSSSNEDEDQNARLALAGGNNDNNNNNNNARSKFLLIKRLILPATRLARGSRVSLALPADEKLQRPAQVRFTEAVLHANSRTGGSDAGEPTRYSSSESLQMNDHNNHGPALAVSSSGLLHIKPLGRELARAILRRWLAEIGRTLSQQQWTIVDRSLGHCSRPIFVKLAFGEMVHWKSYSVRGDARGLTFGSAWLSDFRLASEPDAGRSDLERLVCGRERLTRSAHDEAQFKWQTLAMEQQWLNYLDFNSASKTTEEERRDGRPRAGVKGGDDGAEPDLVIRVGGAAAGGVSGVAGGSPGGIGSASHASSGSAAVCHLSGTIEDAICQLFARIELKHGYLLTKHSLSYITAARNGICENELEDILSLDDVVLDDVFQYHLPPVRRIPPLLWTRIRNDLPDYLSERDADGIVITWHHGQFKTVTERRYLASERQSVYVHSLMADYFLGRWADKAKPFRCTKQQAHMAAEQLESAIQQSMRRDSEAPSGAGGNAASATGTLHAKRQSSLTSGARITAGRLGSGSTAAARSGASFSLRNRMRSSDQHDQRLQWMQAKAHRRVPHQPLFYDSSASASPSSSSSGHLSGLGSGRSEVGDTRAPREEPNEAVGVHRQRRRYNLRKLTELPFHLARAGRFLDLAHHALFNYQWLFATIDALGMQTLFVDLDDAVQRIDGELAKKRRELDKAATESGEEQGPTDRAPGEPEVDDFRTDELAVAAGDTLTVAALCSLKEQLETLINTLRLSASVVHSDPRQLAPQLLGRLLSPGDRAELLGGSGLTSGKLAPRQRSPVADTVGGRFAFINQLLEQCDRDGCQDCGLLPVAHCLQSADGLQLSSLEGHPFGVMCMSLAADRRHLLAASNKFLMWNISTGEVARDVDPKLDGAIIKQLLTSASDKRALARTSDNHILHLEISTQQVSRFDLRGQNSGRRLSAIEAGGVLAQSECCNDDSKAIQIDGMKLIDKRSAKRFFVWLKNNRLLVVHLEELDSEAQPQTEYQNRVEMVIDYELDLTVFVEAGSELLDVEIEQVDGASDLVFVSIKLPTSMMRLNTLNVTQSGQAAVLTLVSAEWPSLEAKLIALNPSCARQLVTVDASGRELHLRRRRATCWSSEKRLGFIELEEGSNKSVLAVELAQGLQARVSAEEEELEELEESGNHADLHDRRLRERLAEFESELDGDCAEVQPAKRAFSDDFGWKSEDQNNNNKNNNNGSSDALEKRAKFVKVFYTNRIVVMGLDRMMMDRDANCASGTNYVQYCLVLPRDVRNVSLSTNRSQLASKIVPKNEDNEHHLIVVATRSLLIYALEAQQLVKRVEAHTGRITSLLTIQTRVGSSAMGDNNLDAPQRGRPVELATSALVTSSMDRTVKIWNLMNLEKDSQTDDRLATISGGHRFEQICTSAQRPLVFCLSRGQLSVWNWQMAKLLHSYDSLEALSVPPEEAAAAATTTTTSDAKTSCSTSISHCKLSKNGAHLALIGCNSKGTTTLSLVAVDGPARVDSFRQGAGADSMGRIALRPWASKALEEGQPARLKFLAHDSRLLVILDLGANPDESTPEREVVAPTSSRKSPTRNLGVVLVTVPELRTLYTINCRVPDCGQSSQGDTKQQSRRRSAATITTDSIDQRQLSGRRRMADVTCDHQFLVVIGLNEEKPTSSGRDNNVVIAQRSSTEQPPLAANKERYATGHQRATPVLLVYTARDGQLARVIDLSKLQVAAQPRLDSMSRQSSSTSRNGLLDTNPAVGRSEQRQQQRAPIGDERRRVASFASIKLGQFDQLRAVRSRDRSSLVALSSGDTAGGSWLIDVGSKCLVAATSSWSGRLSSDGRYGLSRMFAASGDVSGDLQLIEMRHCHSVKSLLTPEQFDSLVAAGVGSSSSQRNSSTANNEAGRADKRVSGLGAGGRGRLICGFNKPNDAYVYICEPRSRQLLLVRVRDNRLVANYRLPAVPSCIKSSSDGLALIIGLNDGALLALAIVDPLMTETLARLGQYPQRKQRSNALLGAHQQQSAPSFARTYDK